jgi:hypothetical protein
MSSAILNSNLGDKTSEVTTSILDFIECNPGVSGSGILSEMNRVYSNLAGELYFNDNVYFILDVLVEKNFLFFDFQEDSWYVIEQQNLTSKEVS